MSKLRSRTLNMMQGCASSSCIEVSSWPHEVTRSVLNSIYLPVFLHVYQRLPNRSVMLHTHDVGGLGAGETRTMRVCCDAHEHLLLANDRN